MDSAGARSKMSQDMQEITQGKEDISKQAQGHKANLSNPNTSESSKEHSRQIIDELGGDSAHIGGEDQPRSRAAAESLEK